MTNPDVDPIELEDKYHDADEMCAVSVLEHEITYLTEFCEKIKTLGTIESAATSVHGITRKDLEKCREEKHVLEDFLAFISQPSSEKRAICTNDCFIVLVAHNAKYDKSVLERALKRNHLKLPEKVSWQCTIEISKALDVNKEYKHSLKDCYERLGMQYINAHSALPDAQMCASVFRGFFLDPNEEEYRNGVKCVFEQEENEWKEIELEINEYRKTMENS